MKRQRSDDGSRCGVRELRRPSRRGHLVLAFGLVVVLQMLNAGVASASSGGGASLAFAAKVSRDPGRVVGQATPAPSQAEQLDQPQQPALGEPWDVSRSAWAGNFNFSAKLTGTSLLYNSARNKMCVNSTLNTWTRDEGPYYLRLRNRSSGSTTGWVSFPVVKGVQYGFCFTNLPGWKGGPPYEASQYFVDLQKFYDETPDYYAGNLYVTG